MSSYTHFLSGEFYKGWCTLERCEYLIRDLDIHFRDTTNEYGIEHIRVHVKNFQDIFPYKFLTIASALGILSLNSRVLLSGAARSLRMDMFLCCQFKRVLVKYLCLSTSSSVLINLFSSLLQQIPLQRCKISIVSERRNELISEVFHEIHWIEKWGRGISLILSKEPDTDFKEVGIHFIVTFQRKYLEEDQEGNGEKVGEKVGEKKVEKKVEKEVEKEVEKKSEWEEEGLLIPKKPFSN